MLCGPPAPPQTSVIYFLSFGAVDHKMVGEPSGDKVVPRQEMERSRTRSFSECINITSLHFMMACIS